ncbi:ABC transporter [Epibacterium ulvae]|uniref:ABC transporter n=2 Tax=Alphaproteobacteria TaxID=28211 RepID=A0A1G5QIQ9_9RHOB|nr:ABC transporter family protein [alpha proteobacterium U95]SCZ61241.1 ABC transporter [Epibacterium ulvae]
MNMTTSETGTKRVDTAVTLSGVNKWYDNFHVLKDINPTVKRGERIVICGPSGSGKSTLIRCINYLETHQTGSINVDRVEVSQTMKNAGKLRRDAGMVFQSFNLFPHLTVFASTEGVETQQGRGA